MAKFELEGKLEDYYKAVYNDLEQKTFCHSIASGRMLLFS